MQAILIVLLYAFAVLTVFDCVSTYKVIEGGKGSEGNPLVRFFINKLGLVGGLAIVTIPPLVVVGWYISTKPVGSEFEIIAFTALDLFYIKTVISNFKIANS
jgi:hypothetical protein